MKKTLIFVLAVIIVFVMIGILIAIRPGVHHKMINNQTALPTQGSSPTSSNSNINIPTPDQTNECQKNELSGTIMTQGAAGNTYGSIELKNIGKTPCVVNLGNTIAALYEANNIVVHYQQPAQTENFVLDPSAKVYSQIHYPNGAQCQGPTLQKQITFFYKGNKTSVTLRSTTTPTGNLMIQACNSANEKTTVDIWPLSKTPSSP